MAPAQKPSSPTRQLEADIHSCDRCRRLRSHCQKVAREKRKAYLSQDYWGRPIAGFGDPKPKLWILGLAPAAHGANRTGRIFTGDRSGDWLYRALHKAGFANQAQATDREDGLKLTRAFISCAVRCAPPDNKPTPAEAERCLPFLRREQELFTPTVKVYLALGQFAYQALGRLLREDRSLPRDQALPPFAHGKSIPLPGKRMLLLSYHPSQQNTFTGRLTEPMFDSVFNAAHEFLEMQSSE